VAISGDSLIVGHEPRHAAYVFRRTGTVWTEEAKLDVDFNTGNRFDRVVAISGDTVVVSSPYGGAGGAGAAYVFRRAGAAWTYRAKLVAADGGVQSNENYSAGTFGASIALSGETLLVGAPEKSAATGAAYVFRIAPDAAPSPPAPPGYLLASKVRARIDAERPERSKLLVTGTIDTGADAPDFSGPATFDVGGLHLDVPSLVASGKSLVHRADDVVLTLKPSAVGSSRVPFTLTVIGARVSDVAPDATADVRFRNAAHDVGGSVRLAAGSLRRRGLVGPAFHLIKASGVLKGGGEDSFRLALGFAGAGGLPASVDEPITVEFGDALSATFPGASFKRRGATFVRTDGGPGITRAAFDYARGVVTIVGAGLDLGALVEGGNAVTIRVARGDDARTATVRLVRAGKKLAY
jgi:hypothetical protein